MKSNDRTNEQIDMFVMENICVFQITLAKSTNVEVFCFWYILSYELD